MPAMSTIPLADDPTPYRPARMPVPRRRYREVRAIEVVDGADDEPEDEDDGFAILTPDAIVRRAAKIRAQWSAARREQAERERYGAAVVRRTRGLARVAKKQARG